jgi:hypothetical protein
MTREAVPAELLAIASDNLEAERAFAERFNARGTALIAAAGVVLGLVVNVGKDSLSRLRPADPSKTTPLDLGTVGEPLFVTCFLLAVVLLATCAVVATIAVLPGKAALFKTESLLLFADERMPMPQARRHFYAVMVEGIDNHRANNVRKARLLRRAGALFVVALLLTAIDAATLTIQELGR